MSLAWVFASTERKQLVISSMSRVESLWQSKVDWVSSNC